MKKLSILFAFALLLQAMACTEVKFNKAAAEGDAIDPQTPSCLVKQVEVAPTPRIDILFVDDNSGSMFVEQTNMGNRFPTFINSLSSIDWQIGIVTTDMSGTGELQDGNLITFTGTSQKILRSNTPNASSVFLNTIQRPETGSGDERGIYAAIKAVQKKAQNNLFRDSVPLAVIILSDEDERSSGGTLSVHPAPEAGKDMPEDFINTVKSNLGEKSVKVSSIIIQPKALNATQDTACYIAQNQQTTRAFYGSFYARLSNLTNGLIGDICASDYGNQLKAIGDMTRRQVGTYPLKCVPQTTVDVEFSPARSGIDVSVEGDKITFDPPLPGGTTITMEYECAQSNACQ